MCNNAVPVFHSSARHRPARSARHPGPEFSAPVSAATLDIRTFFSLFQSKLMALDPEVRNRLVIEIPESSDMRGAELVRRLRAIKSTGAKVAIDDFGQEHANQERLEAFDWDFCKIDLPAIQTTERSEEHTSELQSLMRH